MNQDPDFAPDLYHGSAWLYDRWRLPYAAALKNVEAVVANAEDLQAPTESFDLVVIGNAFHRMRRLQVARRIATWLRPGGLLALCWSGAPWWGPEPWKPVFSAVLADWRHRLNADDRIPRGLEESRSAHPDGEIVQAAGLDSVGGFEVIIPHDWTPDALAGFSYATSFLPRRIFADRTAEFEADIADRLRPYLHNGVVTDRVSYAYDLFSRPVPADT